MKCIGCGNEENFTLERLQRLEISCEAGKPKEATVIENKAQDRKCSACGAGIIVHAEEDHAWLKKLNEAGMKL